MHTKYAIIGAGISGCQLALQLKLQKQQVLLIDNSNNNRCSIYAAGLINPLAPRGLRATWLRNEIFGSITDYYQNIEQLLDCKLLHAISLRQITFNPSMQKEWSKLALKPEQKNWISPHGNKPYFDLHQVYKLDAPLLLHKTHEYFNNRNKFVNKIIDYNQLRFENNAWHIDENHIAEHLIFCEGWQGESNPFFNYLPWKSSSGVIAKAVIEHDMPKGIAIKYKKWALNAENEYLVGSTFEHGDYSENVTNAEIEELKNDVLNWAKNITIKSAYKGIRPTVADRRPFIGTHKEHKTVHIFNGFGTKACSLCVHLAPQFTHYLTMGAPIEPEANIARFNSHE